jgi:hypothetical protein
MWLQYIFFITFSITLSYKGWAGETYGSIIFDNLELEEKLNLELKPYHIRPEVTKFIGKSIEGSEKIALVLQTTVNELEATGIPIEIVSIAIARWDNPHSELSQLIYGKWLRNLRTGEEHQIADYKALLPIPNDLKLFDEEPKAYEKLLSPNNILWTYFIIKEDSQEKMISTNGLMEDYGVKAPTKRSKTFARLYDLLNEVWTGDRDDYARILAEKQ